MKHGNQLSLEERKKLYDDRVQAVRRIIGEVLESLTVDRRGEYVWTVIDGERHRSWILCDNEGIVAADRAIVILLDGRLFFVQHGSFVAADQKHSWNAILPISLLYSDHDKRVLDYEHLGASNGFDLPESENDLIGWRSMEMLSKVVIKLGIKFGRLEKTLTGVFARA